MWNRIFYLGLIFLIKTSAASDEKHVPEGCLHGDTKAIEEPKTDCPVSQGDGQTILASLLDGSLIAINKRTGTTKWKLMDEPVVKSPYDPMKPILPAFLPDPKDGALYMMGGSREDPLKKLPFTIPELVAASPSRSTDGILYSGKKIDTWLSVNTVTGAKQGSLSYEGCLQGEEDMCPVMAPGTILIGRTEYNIMMFDTRTKDRKWNITYYDYSSNLGGIDVSKDYDLAHFTDSSTGALISLDKNTGSVLWETQFSSPVVAMYQLASDSIASIPFTSVSIETLDNLMLQFQSPERRSMIGETKLFPTLYVGEHEHGLFAVPSLVDEQTMMISPAQNGHLLIEGPRNVDVPSEIDIEVTTGKVGTNSKYGNPFNQHQIPKDKSSVLLFGYYQVPEYPTIALSSNMAPFQLTTSQTMFPFQVHEVKVIEGPEISDRNDTNDPTAQLNLPYNHKELMKGIKNIKQLNTTFIFSTEIVSFINYQILPFSALTVQEIENKEMKLGFIVFILTVIWFIRFVKHQFKMWEKGFGRTSNSGSNSMSKGSVGSVSNYEITATPVELDDGTIKVGNISFDPLSILGKGCEGTFVYKGKFDNRDVAVKRVLAACFSIADREVELLRESDEHPNVVRYFCMEQCRQFRYIALELCVATLQDYVEGRYSEIKLDIAVIFRQSVQGLAHLHALDIAHRDIKPQNVLISTPGKKGDVRAMISDFGLCKKLKVGRMSFSRRSGVAGTEGWIAPEMLLGHRSTTCMVDIFSMGCVYFYLLTNGKHPFGENFHRQANILSGKANLELLDREKQNSDVTLIEKMISFEPNDRPPALALLKHPVFWVKDKILTFLQDVSDRVDKEEDNSFVLNTIERCGNLVTKGDWQEQLDPAVKNDLRKHRTYKGKSVRDLLRAIRNKKHHYRELTDDAKLLYGKMPGEFSDYWTKRFPRLVTHSYNAMQCVKYENNFTKYYHKDYDYVPTRVRHDGLVVSKPDLSEADADIFSPKFLDRGETKNNTEFVATGKQDSLVSNWSQLDSGNNSRLEDLCIKDNMLPCERDPSSEEGDAEETPMYPVEGEIKSHVAVSIAVVKEKDTKLEVQESICPSPKTKLPARNYIEETHLCDKEIIESTPCDKENLNPIIPDESEAKTTGKKNKKRRKHQKKNRVESPGTQEDT
eukprot:TRINITY_DN458_c0_g1_i1.p1 TRINITY_DN458_c0_g1~~TRINITY_DN458_c0_g1_i1.p1  ORF type:complete len:1157 (-),score=196.13 TRINITY_DN458_c0_g1_i1:177-3647(-)